MVRIIETASLGSYQDFYDSEVDGHAYSEEPSWYQQQERQEEPASTTYRPATRFDQGEVLAIEEDS